jgi:molybdenum cofactor cytidylyltransferase
MQALKGALKRKTGMKKNEAKAAGLVLAAGASSRMGKPKQLLPVLDETLLGRVLNESLKSDLDKVVLVLGHQAEEIQAAIEESLEHPKLLVIVNRRYEEGISSSVRAGLSVIEGSHSHVMVILADMPHIDANLINILLRQYRTSGLPIGAVKIKNRRSHPVIFSRKMYPELHRLKGDRGARDLFQRCRDKVILVEPEGVYDDRDIDTPEDYASFQKSLKGDRFSNDDLKEVE